ELWVNGKRATRARQPNDGFFRIKSSPDAATSRPDAWAIGQTRFEFDEKDVPAGPFAFGAEVVAMCRWVESRLPITSVDEAKHLVSFARRSQFRLEPDDRYWLPGGGA